MKHLLYTIVLLISANLSFAQNGNSKKFVLVIQGGAGTILRSEMTPEKEKAYTQGLNDALQTGYNVLAKGGTALDAVEASIKVLEDNPLFNAGKGAEQFAAQQGCTIVNPSYFFTEERWKSLLKEKANDSLKALHNDTIKAK